MHVCFKATTVYSRLERSQTKIKSRSSFPTRHSVLNAPMYNKQPSTEIITSSIPIIPLVSKSSAALTTRSSLIPPIILWSLRISTWNWQRLCPMMPIFMDLAKPRVHISDITTKRYSVILLLFCQKKTKHSCITDLLPEYHHNLCSWRRRSVSSCNFLFFCTLKVVTLYLLPRFYGNAYGTHPVYTEIRNGKAHGALLMNAHGMDILTVEGRITWKVIGGILDFYFFVPKEATPNAVLQSYTDLVGKPMMPGMCSRQSIIPSIEWRMAYEYWRL